MLLSLPAEFPWLSLHGKQRSIEAFRGNACPLVFPKQIEQSFRRSGSKGISSLEIDFNFLTLLGHATPF